MLGKMQEGEKEEKGQSKGKNGVKGKERMNEET